jgi:hypothetical protein
MLAVGVSVGPESAATADLVGFYVGGAVGRAAVEVDHVAVVFPGGVPLDFDEHHVGWKALFGVRPVSVLGAEFEYVNFGHPSIAAAALRADAQVRGPAIFALGYVPLPLPLLDVYGKVGLARLETTAAASSTVQLGLACDLSHPALSTCGPEGLSTTDNRFAWGAGVQIKLSKIAVRGEYERFMTSVGKPDFLSVGVTWSF